MNDDDDSRARPDVEENVNQIIDSHTSVLATQAISPLIADLSEKKVPLKVQLQNVGNQDEKVHSPTSSEAFQTAIATLDQYKRMPFRCSPQESTLS